MDKEEYLFASVFGYEAWDRLPRVLKNHYLVRIGSGDQVVLEGHLDVYLSKFMKLLSPFIRMFGALVPYAGEKIPVTVTFTNPSGTRDFHFNRIFRYEGKLPYHFQSTVSQIKGHETIELMRFGLGWRADYHYDGKRITLTHKGYSWKIFGICFPIPLSLVLGKGYAEEEALSDNEFCMRMVITHPLFGKNFEYKGQFRVEKVGREK